MARHLEVDLVAGQIERPREQPVPLEVEDARLALFVAVADVHDLVRRDPVERGIDGLDDPVLRLKERQRLGDLDQVDTARFQIAELCVIGLGDVLRQGLEIVIALVGRQGGKRGRTDEALTFSGASVTSRTASAIGLNTGRRQATSASTVGL